MISFTVEEVQGDVPVTILGLIGELDASTYKEVIGKAAEIHKAGVRDLLLDLSELAFMASSGLVALHSVALIMRGQEPPEPGAGWSALQPTSQQEKDDEGLEVHCKLLNPRPRVARTLQIAGFDKILEIYTDKREAIDSF